MSRLAVIFYVIVVMYVGVIMLLFVSHGIPFFESAFIAYEDVASIVFAGYHDARLRLTCGVIAAVLLLNNFIFWKAISVNQAREKIITRDNPVGRVSVSIAALEDLIRRSVANVREVRDARCVIRTGKRDGKELLSVTSQLILNTDVNIPELSCRLQEMIKRKIQSTIGIEEMVDVRVDVTKIVPVASKEKQQKNSQPSDDNLSDSQPQQIPFQGYRA
jgi:uncharacterized alkaline shock family protein YloU